MHEKLVETAERLAALGERPAPEPPDEVNAAMIRNWTQALGDTRDWGDEAPPAMAQVWSMQGLSSAGKDSPAAEILRMLDDGGYTGVLGTNCEHAYDRPARLGERLRATMRFGGVAGPKRTAMGEGYFVTWYESWYAGDERVAEMLFRVLKFRPMASAPTLTVAGPPATPVVPPSDRPPLTIELTPTFVISTAIATRDFTPVHHDPALARAQGSKDIFLNILTTMGLVQRYALETHPDAALAGIRLRLGAPAYAGDTLTLTATREGDSLEVLGTVGLGTHVQATVTFR
ncbi:MaoC/PaaZ C-terminal domain-containing protein [Actinocorallia sp. B10E7]|uniref:MaoC/PaaZ C-terminal domain-containing protein n=1 Tax=Actinocorallia sp. B10E7 TaxID=3153558 RepID=UPI00325D78D3